MDSMRFRSGCRRDLPKNAVALAVAWALMSGGIARAAESLEEVVIESTYTTGDRLDTATGLGLTIFETPQSVSVMTFERVRTCARCPKS